MAMYNPPHPGALLREEILPALNLTVTDAAKQLGISRVALSRVVNEKAAISIELARLLEKWLGGPNKGPRAETWLKMQLAHDLWQSTQNQPKLGVKVRAVR